jgi:putative nucleotidyltransferase with HDIG domain
VTAQRRATEEDRELRLRIEKEALDHSSALYDIKGKLAAELRHHEAADNQARQSLAGTLQALARISEMRDMYTAGHQERVAGLCVAIATELGWSEDQRRFVKLAASLHDIGKMAVPAEILSKPSSLTYAEFELVKSHAEASVAILEHITFPWPIAEVVGQHHERLDGSGYPLGLTGDLIMPEAKVIAVADVVEAIASHRPYRPALGVDRALEEIRRGRGSLYDAEAVDACIAVFERGDFSFSEPTNPKVDVSSTSRRRQ